MAVLTKGMMILTSGFVRVSNGAIIPAALVNILSDADSPVLVDQVNMNKAIGEAISKAKIELLSTDDISNMETNFDQFIKANKQLDHPQFSVVDIKYTGADELYIDPPTIESYIFDGVDYQRLTIQIELRKTLNLLIEESANQPERDEVLLLDGSQTMEAGYVPQADTDVEVVKSTKEKIAAAVSDIKGIDNTRDQTQQDLVLDIFEDERGDYVRVQDLVGAVEVNADIVPTENENNVEIDLSGLDLSPLVKDRLTTFKLTPNSVPGDSIYLRDSFNNATSTPNRTLGTDTSVMTTNQLLTITGLNNARRDQLVNDYTLKLVSQVNSNVGANIDQVARDLIAKETTARIEADGKLQSKLITNPIDGLTSVEAILKANNDLTKENKKVIAQLGAKKVSGGDLLSTAETLATEKFVEDNESVKDLTHLTTQDEVFNAVETGTKTYNIKLNGVIYNAYAFSKSDTNLVLHIRNGVSASENNFERVNCAKGSTAVLSGLQNKILTGTPTLAGHSATKGYVDGEITKIPTLQKPIIHISGTGTDYLEEVHAAMLRGDSVFLGGNVIFSSSNIGFWTYNNNTGAIIKSNSSTLSAGYTLIIGQLYK